MQNRKMLDAEIKSSLAEAAAQVAASDLLEIRIRSRLESRQIKEENKNAMKKIFTLKRIVAIAAVVCCLATATAFASGALTRFTSFPSPKPNYTSIPSARQLDKDIGFAPKVVNAFSNGYTFKQAKIVNGKATDETGKTEVNYKGLSTDYTAADGQIVQLSANISSLMSGDKDKGTISSYNGIDLKYLSQTYKFVPDNYTMTADDEKAQADGSVIFSHGSDEISTEALQFVQWTQNGIHYQFMTRNVQLAQQNLLNMAQELIDLK